MMAFPAGAGMLQLTEKQAAHATFLPAPGIQKACVFSARAPLHVLLPRIICSSRPSFQATSNSLTKQEKPSHAAHPAHLFPLRTFRQVCCARRLRLLHAQRLASRDIPELEATFPPPLRPPFHSGSQTGKKRVVELLVAGVASKGRGSIHPALGSGEGVERGEGYGAGEARARDAISFAVYISGERHRMRLPRLRRPAMINRRFATK